MTSGKLRSRLLFVHRALALILAPFLVVLCLSGIVLAFQPLAGEGKRSPVDPVALLAALREVDPEGSAGLLIVAPAGDSFELRSRGPGVRGRFGIASRQALPEDESFDVYAAAERLHKGLLLGWNPLMEAAAFGILFLLLIGPFVIGRFVIKPGGSATLAQRHASLGLFFWPLILLPPVTGVMMVLHWGEPARPPEAPPEERLTLAGGLERAAPQLDLARLEMARRWPSGEVLLYVAAGRRGREEAIYKVAAAGDPVVFAPPRNWPHDLHEGRWSRRGAILNMAAAVTLLTLMGSGLVSWWRRRGNEGPSAPASLRN